MPISATPPHLLNTSREGDSTTSLGSLFWYLTSLWVNTESLQWLHLAHKQPASERGYSSAWALLTVQILQWRRFKQEQDERVSAESGRPGRPMALCSVYMTLYNKCTVDLWYLAWDSLLLIVHIHNKYLLTRCIHFTWLFTIYKGEDLNQSCLGCLYSRWSQQILLGHDSLNLPWASFLELGKLHNSLTIKRGQGA